jgi:glyoxylase-like metal-dependent hydrolase (beta-lactamase superfamily II)
MSLRGILPNVFVSKTYSNAYVLVLKDHCIIVDSGMDKKAEDILSAVKKSGKPPKAVLMTHGHMDHIMGLPEIKKRYPNIHVVSDREDKPAIEGRTTILPRGIMGFFMGIASRFMGYTKVREDVVLDHGVYMKEVKVVKTPGHTKGGLSFIINIGVKRILFPGDMLTNVDDNIGLPPDDYNLDRKRMYKTLRDILKEDFNAVLPGHGNPILRDPKGKIKAFLRGMS